MSTPTPNTNTGGTTSATPTGNTPTPSGRGNTPQGGRSGNGGRGNGRGWNRNGGRGSGRGGRGGGSNNSRSPRQPVFKGAISEMNGHVFQCFGETTTGVQYNRTVEELETYAGTAIKYNAADIKKMIRTMKDTVFRMPDDLQPGANQAETAVWNADIALFTKRRAMYHDNKCTLYSAIWSQCSDAMQAKVKASDDYDTLYESNDALLLLKIIKGIAHNFESQRNVYLALHQAKRAFYSMQQGKDESNVGFMTRFKNSIDVIEHYGGSVDGDPATIDTELKALQLTRATATPTQLSSATSTAKNKMRAMAFLRSTDRTRYGTLLDALENQSNLQHDQYPVTVSDAYNILLTYVAPTPNKQAPTRPAQHTPTTISSAAPEDSGPEVSFAQLSLVQCYNCQEMGHYASTCPNNPRPRGSGSEPTPPAPAVQLFQCHDATADDASTDDAPLNFGFCQVTRAAEAHGTDSVNSNWVLLDSESTVSIFRDKRFLVNIRRADKPLRLVSNGGYQESHLVGDLPGFGTVWYNPTSLANILSLAHVRRTCRVTMDSSVDAAFLVYTHSNHPLVFHESPRGLYYHDVTAPRSPKPTNTATNAYSFLTSVATAKANYTVRQVRGADQAKRVYELVGRPSHKTFLKMIIQNQLANCPITVDDANRALQIYGKDVHALRGKTVRRTPEHVPSNQVMPLPPDILKEHRNVTLCFDIFFVDKITFLVTISRNLHFITVHHLKSRSILKQVLPSLKQVNNLYKARGFKIVSMHADEEFASLVQPMLELDGINLNIAATKEHVPEAERCIRTIKERNRATVSALPFKHYPKMLKVSIVKSAVTWLNMFPPSDGVSETISPRTLVTGIKPDFKKHCRVPIGSYCETHEDNEPTNKEDARTVPSIALTPTGNLQGSYHFMSMLTGQRLSRRKWSELPITNDIIDRVHEIAATEAEYDDDADDFQFTWDEHDPLPDDENEDEHGYHDDQISIHGDNMPVQEHGQPEQVPPLGNNDVEDEQHMGSDQNNTEQDSDSSIQEHQEADRIVTTEPASETSCYPPTSSSDEQLDEDEDEELEEESQLTEENGAFSNRNNGPAEEYGAPPGEDQGAEDTDGNVDTMSNAPEANADIGTAVPEDTADTTNNTSTHGYSLRGNRMDFSHRFDHIFAQATGHIAPSRPTTNPEADMRNHIMATGHSFNQMGVKAGVKMFGDKAVTAVVQECKQLDDKGAFEPRHRSELDPIDVKRALRALTLVKEKRCGRIKGRTVANGRDQRGYISKDDSTSPTVSTEGLMISMAIDAKEERDVATADVEGAYLQADMDETVIMFYEGDMVDHMVAANPEKYGAYVDINKDGKKRLYVELKKALYGCMRSGLLWYNLFSSTLVKMGFTINPYEPCVANREYNGKQCTICWYVDDLKISHVDPEIVTHVINEIEARYGKMVVTRGRKHTYVGMDIEYTENNEVTIFMKDYITECIADFPEDCTMKVTSAGAAHLFDVNEGCSKINEDRRQLFHSIVAKLLFVAKRGRPDILPTISFLTSRVTKADEDDWKKLKRLLQYLNGTLDLKHTMSIDNISVIKTWVDASYGIHHDMRSHTGGCILMGKGVLYARSTAQKINVKSSTEAELVGASDFLPQTIWTRMFIEAQGYKVKDSDFYQDNMSAMKLEKNGRASAGQRSRHINIRYFFIKDRIAKGDINLLHCPTAIMVADFFTKPLQGPLFAKFRDIVLGIKHFSVLDDPASDKPRSVLEYEDPKYDGVTQTVTSKGVTVEENALPITERPIGGVWKNDNAWKIVVKKKKRCKENANPITLKE